MLNQFSRTELLLGREAMERLSQSRVAVFDLIDDDKVCLTNLNRQIIAARKTVGRYKAEVRIHKCFFLAENADIYKTKVCPLAKVMRRELKKRGVKKLKVVYSEERPVRPLDDMAISCRTNCICPPGAEHKCTERRAIPGSTAFVPSIAGLIIAGEMVKDLVKDCIQR